MFVVFYVVIILYYSICNSNFKFGKKRSFKFMIKKMFKCF